MYLVMTTVKVKSGKVDEVRDLFERTNPVLVKDQTDWVEAKFTANREEDQVTVLAFWRNAESYKTFSSSDEFRQVMSQFASYFAGPPQVTINEILFEMRPGIKDDG
jgi:heme-degrading monooxygenase HmoA